MIKTNLNKEKKFYNLMMFPYPSAEGLHVGNMYAFTGADIYGRYKRMRGYEVFEPIGLDGFGIHSENYAIEINKHPKEQAKVSEKRFYDQLSKIGNGFDWQKRLETYDPEYYKWTQWLFIKIFKEGLAYKASANVNWCKSCKTVLANEQVIDEKCERCREKVVKKEMNSWFFGITKYAERLLGNIDGSRGGKEENFVGPQKKGYDVKRNGLIWPDRIKTAQKNWIGKKQGINISYPIKGKDKTVECFTTRLDTNFGATFIVVSPEYVKDRLLDLISETKKTKTKNYINKALNKTEQQRQEEGREKSGVFTGLYAINQLNNYEMPIWVSDFVLKDFGTGVVVGVPGHDKRDFEFAEKFKLPVIRVVAEKGKKTLEITKTEQVFEGEGRVINSDFLNGLQTKEAIKKINNYVVRKGWGKKHTSYHLRDWLISRQRYWGPPIPMIYCQNCADKGRGENKSMPGWFTVSEKELPVILPDIKDYKPKGDGTSPLSNAPEEWKNVKCKECGSKAVRELDVSDTFLDSSWYFLAYPNLNTKEWVGTEKPFNDKITKHWLPVDAYIGGAEHAVLHLLYSRFVTMALFDMGYLDFEEPFPFLYGHGLLIKDGAKMSKSRGNVVNPDNYIEKYGADTLRMYLMFLGPFDAGGDFRDSGIEGMKRFIKRIWDLFENRMNISIGKEDEKRLELIKNKTVKKVSEDIEKFRYNTAISATMEYVNALRSIADNSSKGENSDWLESLRILSQLTAPFAPDISERAWKKVGGKQSVHSSKWPEFDPKKIIEESINIAIQVDGKLRAIENMNLGDAGDKEKIVKMAMKNAKVEKWLKKGYKDVVSVPNKLVNFVTKTNK